MTADSRAAAGHNHNGRGRQRRVGATFARLWTLVVRFALVFFLARFLTPDEVGLYGLVVATVGFTIYLLGLDLYTYTSREILRTPQPQWRSQVISHFALLAIVGAVGLPLSVLVFAVGLLPWSVLLWFLLLVPTEHIGYEIDRMLIAMSDQLSASVLVFVRQGILPTIIIPLFIFVPGSRSLDTVFFIWVAFNLIAVLAGLALLIRKTRNATRVRVDWGWARAGVRIALPFLVGTLALKGLFTFDRQAVLIFGSLADVGAYTFAMSVAAGLTSVLAVAVHQFSYPQLVQSAHQHDEVSFKRQLRSLWVQSVLLVVLAIGATFVLGPVLVQWVGGSVYAENAWLLPASMFAIGLYNLSMVPHYELYAIQADRVIAWVTVGSVCIFGVVTGVSVACGAGGLLATIVGVAAACFSLLVSKQVAARLIRPKHFARAESTRPGAIAS